MAILTPSSDSAAVASDAAVNRRRRWVSLAVGGPAWAVISLAALLTPNPDGVGTHRQLGLGACTILSITGYPCPMCGMTTTFTHMAHLDPLSALATQPFGVVLFLGTLSVAILALWEGLSPRGRWDQLLTIVERWDLRIALTLFLGLIGGWLYKVAAMDLWPLGG